MPILRIDIPATVPELRNYAASLKCPENTSVSDGNGGFIVTPTDDTFKANFLTNGVKGIVSKALSEAGAQAVKETKDSEYRNEADALRIAIENAMTVSII